MFGQVRKKKKEIEGVECWNCIQILHLFVRNAVDLSLLEDIGKAVI